MGILFPAWPCSWNIDFKMFHVILLLMVIYIQEDKLLENI